MRKPTFKPGTSRHLCVAAVWCLAGAVCPVILAQYAIQWHTIDGGGGVSTGGTYSVNGTIGQPDASPALTGGTFVVVGGFWALPVAVQTTNAPTLRIEPTGPGLATISWETGAPGYVLQEADELSLRTAWLDSPSGSTNPVVVPATIPSKYYRLHKP